MTNLVVQWAQAHGPTWIHDLVESYHIKATIDGDRVSLTYDQLESPMGEPIVQQCRGMVLTLEGTLLAWPYHKFWNHNEGRADSIHWETARVQEKLDGCLQYDTSVNLWGGGTVPIGHIVNKELTPTLVGMDEAGKLVPCQITGWANNGRKDNWLRLRTTGPSFYRKACHHESNIVLTSNHAVFANGKWVPAGTLQPGDELVSAGVTPSAAALQLIRSSVLGDGNLSLNGNGAWFTEGHVQKEATTHIGERLGSCLGGYDTRTSGFGSEIHRVRSKTYRSLKALYDEWYGTGSREPPLDLSWVNDFTIAKWYMDNGSLAHSELQDDRACLATNAFSEESVHRLADLLRRMYGVSVAVYQSKGWCIRVNRGRENEIERFWGAIAPFTLPTFRYKLPIRHREGPLASWPQGEEEVSTERSRVLNIAEIPPDEPLPGGRCGYDLETTTHNYMASNVLVHNSLMIMFHTDGAWWVASSGHPTAGGNYGSAAGTFRDMFWEIFTSTGMQLPPPAFHDVTFLFELCSPSNRIVVTYDRPMLVCHGARFRTTGVELSREVLEAISTSAHWPIVTQYPILSLQEALEKAGELDPIRTEGFVVVDAHGGRIKIKSPRYVVLHHMRGQATVRRAIELYQTGEMGEVLGYFPEFSGVFLPVIARFDEIAGRIQADWIHHRDAEDRKAYALAIKDRPWASILFKMFGKDHGKDLMTIKALLRASSLTLLEELMSAVVPPIEPPDKAQ